MTQINRICSAVRQITAGNHIIKKILGSLDDMKPQKTSGGDTLNQNFFRSVRIIICQLKGIA